MALNDNAVMVPGKGYFYIAPTGTAAPTGSGEPGGPWINVGHTSRDEPLTISREGGDRETLGSWQNEALRERIEPTTYQMSFRLLQYDELAHTLYYGGGQVGSGGRFEVPKTPKPQEHALYVVIVDGANTWDRHFPKTSILGSDDEEHDVENLSGMPVAATILGDSALDSLFTVGGPGLVTTPEPIE